MANGQDVSGAFTELRERALSLKPRDLTVKVDMNSNRVFGILMERTRPDSLTVSLMSLIDGTTSMYFSNGEGILDCEKDENVKLSTIIFVNQSNQFVGKMKKTDNLAPPREGMVKFFLLRADGVYSAEEAQDELAKASCELSDLFSIGSGVIAKVRESRKNGK